MSTEILLSDSVKSIKGVGDKKYDTLLSMGISSVFDLLNYYPYKYKDKRNVFSARNLEVDKDALIVADLLSVSVRGNFGKRVIECKFSDNNYKFSAVFFNKPYIYNQLKVGSRYTLFGSFKFRNDFKIITNPEIVLFESPNDVRGIIPVYKTQKGITSNDISKFIKTILFNCNFKDWLPNEILDKNRLCSMDYMYSNLHFPLNESSYKAARFRYIYEQLLIYQVALRLNSRRQDDIDSSIPDVDISDFVNSLSFNLTDGQLNCIKDLESDLISIKPMNRLVQGDVGCGKTVIAEAAIYKCAKSGLQSAFMVPTEVLARQHYEKIKKDFNEFGIEVGLLISDMKVRERNKVLQSLKDGIIKVIIGTHSLIQEGVQFNSLSLVITDEQHRFGVNQRKALFNKGNAVNTCVMSATPIPRSLAATIYGDLDFSIIKDKPINRKDIITRVVDSNSRGRAYSSVKDELKKGHQAYVVAPSIDSDYDDISSVENLYKELKAKFSDYNVDIIHGRLDSEVKKSIMQDFEDGLIDMLVSTTVIEVGVDVPNATIIVIENCDRYGLAQLHQLRGRVGRSSFQSFCYLVNYSNSEAARERAKAMCKYNNGFEISEIDFQMRGPGDIAGTMQSGNYQSSIVSLSNYKKILDLALIDADEILLKNNQEIIEHVNDYMLRMCDNSNVI